MGKVPRVRFSETPAGGERACAHLTGEGQCAWKPWKRGCSVHRTQDWSQRHLRLGSEGERALGLGTGLSLTQEGATHLSGRHSTARAGSPSGCRRWSRCCLWWLSRCSDPRHTAGLHSTHCPGCRPAGSGEAHSPLTDPESPACGRPAGKPGDIQVS